MTYFAVLTRKGGVGTNKMTSLSGDMLIDIDYTQTAVYLMVLLYLCFRAEMW